MLCIQQNGNAGIYKWHVDQHWAIGFLFGSVSLGELVVETGDRLIRGRRKVCIK